MRKRGLKNPSIINRGYRPSKYHKDSSYPSIAHTHTHTHIYSHSQRDWILCKNKLVHYNMWSAWELYRPQECFDMGLYTSAKNTLPGKTDLNESKSCWTNDSLTN